MARDKRRIHHVAFLTCQHETPASLWNAGVGGWTGPGVSLARLARLPVAVLGPFGTSPQIHSGRMF
jgi:hypothetical protein